MQFSYLPSWISRLVDKSRHRARTRAGGLKRAAPPCGGTARVAVQGHFFGGISTPLITWMTPFEAGTSAVVTCTPFT